MTTSIDTTATAEPKTCPWCGHPDDCETRKPGQSPHHFLCCLDRYAPPCLWSQPTDLDRIMREDRDAEMGP